MVSVDFRSDDKRPAFWNTRFIQAIEEYAVRRYGILLLGTAMLLSGCSGDDGSPDSHEDAQASTAGIAGGDVTAETDLPEVSTPSDTAIEPDPPETTTSSDTVDPPEVTTPSDTAIEPDAPEVSSPSDTAPSSAEPDVSTMPDTFSPSDIGPVDDVDDGTEPEADTAGPVDILLDTVSSTEDTSTSCTPGCDGVICGSDGCGGSCGTCDAGTTCEGGVCLCVADCSGQVCGSDGCGGSCGSCQGYMACADFGASCQAPLGTENYRVGVDYHATTTDFVESAFLSKYHDPAVRDEVLIQLKGMAEADTDIISTRVWLVNAQGEPVPQAYRWHFPPTEQELSNLRQYTLDVSQIISASGNPMELNIGILYLWCGDYREGSPTTTLGKCDMDVEEYTAALNASTDGIMEAVTGIYRPDGQHAVSLLYLDGEVMTAVDDADPAVIYEKENQTWFLQTYWLRLPTRHVRLE
jgi:hypothetical protein